MNTVTVTVELCAEDRARLDNILAALQNSGTPYCAPQEAPQEPQEAPKAEVVETPAPEAEKPTEEKDAAPAVTVSDVQQKVVALSAKGKKDEVRAVVKAYAEKVSGIPADKLVEVYEKLTALEG